MSDEATGKSGKTRLYVLSIALASPVVFLLCTGPLFVLSVRGIIPGWVFRIIMKPLDMAHSGNSPVSRLVDSYISLWVDLTSTRF